MKKGLLFLVLGLLVVGAKAQYCGNSGSSQCIIDPNHQGFFYPVNDSLPPLENGVVSNAVIQYINSGTITFGGNVVSVQSLRIDSIENLPDGLCWATSDTTNTFTDTGCIKLNGTTCSMPGQYKLRVYITANIGVPIFTTADAAGFKFFVRVKNLSSSDTPVDTSQTSVNPFISYGDSIWGCAYDTLCHAAFTLYPDTTTPHKWWALDQSTSSMPLTYFWSWGDGSGTFGPTPSHNYASPGNYNICLAISNPWGCSNTYCDSSTYIYKTEDMISVQVVNHLVSGITELPTATASFTLSPNPATTSVTVTTPEGAESALLTITDITGRVIMTDVLTMVNRQWSIVNFSNGVYLVTVTDSNGRSGTKKLVISK